MIGLSPIFLEAHAALGTVLAQGNFQDGVEPAKTLLNELGGLHLSPTIESSFIGLRGRVNFRGDDARRRQALHTVHATAGALLAERGLDAFLHEAPGRHLDVVLLGDNRDKAELTETWGPKVFKQAKKTWRSPKRWFEDQLFREMLENPTLKKQMIAFMDVATSLPAEKLGHMFRQYFPEEMTRASGLLDMAMWVGHRELLSDKALGRSVKKVIGMMGKRFLAGETIDEALATATKLQSKGFLTTLDVVREHVVSQKEAEEYRQSIIDLIQKWGEKDVGEGMTKGSVPVRHVSLKLSALTNRFDPAAHDHVVEEVSARLLTIFQEAKRQRDAGHPVMVNVDLEEFHVRDLSYKILWKTLTDPSLAGWDDVGVVVQSYVKDSESVMMQLIDLAKRTGKEIQIRVVKGAYHKYEQIVAERNGWDIPIYLNQDGTDANFRRLVRLGLLNDGRIRLAVGSHNVDDIGYVQDLRESLGIDITRVEQQFLLGVGDYLGRATAKLGIPTRFYAPFGSAGKAIGYEVRRLDEVTPDSAIGQTHLGGSWDEFKEERERRHEASRKGTGDAATTRKKPPFTNEPEPEFSRGEVRRAMKEAIEERKRTFVKVVPMIGEGEVPFDIARAKKVFSPGDLDLALGHVMPSSGEDVDRAIQEAQRGRVALAGLPEGERSRLMRQAAKIARERKYHIAADLVLEAGKTWTTALADVNEGIDFLEAYAIDAEAASKSREALGVGAAIAPFNYPFAIAMGEVAGQLALGNAVLLKPSDLTPMVSRHVIQVLRDAKIPKSAIQFLPGSGKLIGPLLTETPLVDCYAFTGSNPAANDIIQRAAKNPPERGGVKVVVAETGGKNAMIVDETADLDVAVEAVLSGAFGMAGQRCSATSRVIVLDSVYDQFLERLVEGARSLFVGDPSDPKTQVGPVIGQKQFDDIMDYIEVGKREAALAFEPDLSGIKKRGYYIGPHIFKDVPRKARIALEEIFGPVLSVFRAKDFNEAMEIANDTEYALTAGLISRDPANIRRFFEDIQTGNAYANRGQIGARVWETPFGGAKNSGTGPKAGGRHYVPRFSKSRIDIPRGGVLPRLTLEVPDAIPVPEFSDDLQQQIHQAQESWRQQPLKARLLIVSRLVSILQNDARSASDGVRSELNRLSDLLGDYVRDAAQLLTPQSTLELPGEINEEDHDWPLGVGLVWDEHESFYDMVAATAAALVMGNAVVMSHGSTTRFVQRLFQQAGVPKELVTLIAKPSKELLSLPIVQFAVAHGGSAQEVNKLFLTSAKSPVGFRRFIGANDTPYDATYLTRFANARVRTKRTLRHATDLDLPGIL